MILPWGRVPFVVGFGGGVNSVAMLVGLSRAGRRPDLISFADTGGEKPETMSYLTDTLPTWLESVGFPPLTIVRTVCPETGDETLEDACLRNVTLPSRAFGFSSCAFRWKIEPQEKFMRQWGPAVRCYLAGEKPIKALGYDAGEGHRSHSPADELRYYYYYPLRDWKWSREDCEKAIRDAGLPMPVKSACFFCPSSRVSEILALQREHPELMARALAMEDRAMASGAMTDVRGLGRHFSWRGILAADAAQLRMFPEAPVEACTVCVESEDDR
jgi:hypothetical protein